MTSGDIGARIQRSEDGVQVVEQRATLVPKGLGRTLGELQEVVHVDVNVSQRSRPRPRESGSRKGNGIGGSWSGLVWDGQDGRGRGRGHGLQAMGGVHLVAAEGRVGKVGDRFGGSTEKRRGVHPTHGEGKRKPNQRIGDRGREKDTQEGDVGRIDPDPVEPIGNVDFRQEDGTMERIGVKDFGKDTMEGAAELHGLHGGEPDRILIDSKEGVVDNGARPAVALGHHTEGTEPQVGEVLHQGKGEKDPVPFGDHILEFGREELDVLGGAAMGSAEKGRGQLGRGPRRGGHADGNALKAETVQEVRRRVG